MARGMFRDHEKEATWREHVSQQRQGGLSVRRYCQEHNLSDASFYWWRRKLAKRDGGERRGGCKEKRRAVSFAEIRIADSARRRTFLEELSRSSIHPEVLAEVLGQPEADTFDLLCHIAFGSPVRTRSQRATAFRNREQAFISRHKENARQVILELLERYRAGGVEQLEPDIFGISPFREWGGATKISHWFGGPAELGHSLNEIRRRIYAEEAVA